MRTARAVGLSTQEPDDRVTASRQPAAAPPRQRPAGDRSRTISYLAVRVSGVLLAVLVLGHFVVTHITTDVAKTDAAFITKQWSSSLWLVWDSLMLASALVHGGAGAWIAIDDYAANPRRRHRLHVTLVGLCLALLGLGFYVIGHAIYA